MTKVETGTPGREKVPSSQGPAHHLHKAHPLSSLMGEGAGSLQDLLPVMVKVLDAVAHSQKLCDLDPRRILLGEDGSVRVSRQAESKEDRTSVLSSFKYSCPELFQGDSSVSPALSNSYVLGFVFYELLLGQQLFDAQFTQVRQSGGGGWIIWHADKKQRATSIRQLLPAVPSFISEAIEKMMAKIPSERLGDLDGTARLFDRVSQSTATYKALKVDAMDSRTIKGSKARDQDEFSWPRPWLVRLSDQQLWRALWRRVTPEDRRPGWASVQQLERMLQQLERALKLVRSRIYASVEKDSARSKNA
jgi:hypothetical protein